MNISQITNTARYNFRVMTTPRENTAIGRRAEATMKAGLFKRDQVDMIIELISKFKATEDFVRAYLFESDKTNHLWIEISKADTEKVQMYNDLYCNFMFADDQVGYFDFMVFSEGEISCSMVPHARIY